MTQKTGPELEAIRKTIEYNKIIPHAIKVLNIYGNNAYPYHTILGGTYGYEDLDERFNNEYISDNLIIASRPLGRNAIYFELSIFVIIDHEPHLVFAYVVHSNGYMTEIYNSAFRNGLWIEELRSLAFQAQAEIDRRQSLIEDPFAPIDDYAVFLNPSSKADLPDRPINVSKLARTGNYRIRDTRNEKKSESVPLKRTGDQVETLKTFGGQIARIHMPFMKPIAVIDPAIKDADMTVTQFIQRPDMDDSRLRANALAKEHGADMVFVSEVAARTFLRMVEVDGADVTTAIADLPGVLKELEKFGLNNDIKHTDPDLLSVVDWLDFEASNHGLQEELPEPADDLIWEDFESTETNQSDTAIVVNSNSNSFMTDSDGNVVWRSEANMKALSEEADQTNTEEQTE